AGRAAGSRAEHEQVRGGKGQHRRHHSAARAGGADDLLPQQHPPPAGVAVADRQHRHASSRVSARRTAAPDWHDLPDAESRAVPA
ncbi:hypothetical protein G9O61_00g022920, partial [Vairimorpha ceranae]